MKYINKQIAKETAFNMMKTVRDAIESKERELELIAESAIINTIDADIYKIINELPSEWIQKRNYFYVSVVGLKSINVSLSKSIRWKQVNECIVIDRESYETIVSMQKELIDMRDKRDQLNEQLIESLIKLRTIEKIKKEFPEAFKHIPQTAQIGNTVVAVPYESILKGIKEFPK